LRYCMTESFEFENEEAASCFENTEELKQPSISLSRDGSTVKVFMKDGGMDGHFFSDGTDFGKFVFAFLKKEFFEYTKTYKLFIMLMIFIIFGITNPLIAKLMPEIVGSLVTDGVVITLPEPTAYDAWAQFFKNATQMGLFVMVILFSGVLSSELSKGTLINLLTKGLSRTAVILSKYTCMVSVWTISISLCFGLTYGYTAYLFPQGETSNLLITGAVIGTTLFL